MSRLAEIHYGSLEDLEAVFNKDGVSLLEAGAAIQRLAREVLAIKAAVLRLKQGGS